MAMWSCPHCGAAQAAAARCWVCHRSSTTCSTCRQFRTSLAADVGWCALDRRRRPLTGLELRGCWTERGVTSVGDGRPAGVPTGGPAAAVPGWPGRPALAFVPVDAAPVDVPVPAPPGGGQLRPVASLDNGEGWDARVTLFGDAER